MDIKNDYFDQDRLEDMVDEVIIEDKDADRYLIDMALQLSQQNEGNRTKYNYRLSTFDKYNRKHGPQLSQYFQFLMPKYFHHPPQQSSMQCA